MMEGVKETMPSVLMSTGALLLAPLFLPAVATVGRPAVKGLIKGAYAAADAGRAAARWLGDAAHDTMEQMGDIVAEVRAERSGAKRSPNGARTSKSTTRSRSKRSRKSKSSATARAATA